MEYSKRLFAGLTLLSLLITGCNSSKKAKKNDDEGKTQEETFTITWKNYDDSLLETDYNVPKGEVPTYDGPTPTKPNDSNFQYTWSGWSPTVRPAQANQTYYAQYTHSSIKYYYTIDFDLNGGSSSSYDGSKTIETFKTDIFFFDVVKTGWIFKGWYYEGSKVFDENGILYNQPELVNDMVFKAMYVRSHNAEELSRFAATPTLINGGKTIRYGLYPQTNVSDESLIAALDNLTTPDLNGFYYYQGNYYAKNISIQSHFTFDSGIEGQGKITRFWFKCEPILWDVLSNDSGKYLALSNRVLDSKKYYSSRMTRYIGGNVYANNYKYSDVRSFLINTFHDSAFLLKDDHLLTTTVDNSGATTDQIDCPHLCENTQDKIFLLSYKDYLNSSYGFSSSKAATSTRCAKTTDFVRTKQSYSTKDGLLYNSTYWTRSPLGFYDLGNGMTLKAQDRVWTIRTDGSIIDDPRNEAGVDFTDVAIRPAITVALS